MNAPIVANESAVTVDLLRASYRSESFPQEWTDEQRRQSLDRYLKWLRLKQMNPTHRLAPTKDIDMFWHLHMLAPVAYHRDCMTLFGRVLDHNGGFGNTPDELPELQRVFTETAQLWESTYAEPYGEDGVWIGDVGPTNCWHNCQSRCWHACSDKKRAFRTSKTLTQRFVATVMRVFEAFSTSHHIVILPDHWASS